MRQSPHDRRCIAGSGDAPLRGSLAVAAPGQAGGALDLGGGFGLHPALGGLHGLHEAGQMRFAPAVA